MTTKSTLPTIAVGITSYNAGSYIGACLDSLVAQTIDRSRLEVIVVDDGSTDETVEIANSYAAAAAWGSFSVLTQPNSGGPATGRNRIIDTAKADFIFFVDVDDFLGPFALERMAARASVQDADVVLGKFIGVGRGVPKYLFRSSESTTNVEKMSLTDSMNVLKMFRTTFIKQIGYRFNPSLRMAEDHPFALASYAYAANVAIEADVDCYFCVRHDSPKGAAQHLTGHVLPVREFYAYMHESMGVLALARAAGAPYVDAASRRYWDRLLGLDIPRELLRTRSPDEASASVDAARDIVNSYGAKRYQNSMRANANAMFVALQMRDEKAIRSVALQIKNGTWLV